MPLGVILDTASGSSPFKTSGAFPCHQPNLESPTSNLQPLQEAAQFLKGPKPLWAPAGTSANPKSSFGVPQALPSLSPSPKPEGVRSFAQFGQGPELLTPVPSEATIFPFGDPKCVSEAHGQIQGDVCPADPASNGPTGFIFIVGAAGRQNGAPGPSTPSYFIFNCFQSPRSDDPDGAQWP